MCRTCCKLIKFLTGPDSISVFRYFLCVFDEFMHIVSSFEKQVQLIYCGFVQKTQKSHTQYSAEGDYLRCGGFIVNSFKYELI